MRALILAPLLFLGSVAHAEEQAEAVPDPTPETYRMLVVYGDDPCPRSETDDIVVCAREPESERYRLPKRFRDQKPEAAKESWTNTAQSLEMVSKEGLPNSCSVIGSNGQSGCFRQFARIMREQRQADARERAGVP